MMRDAVHSIVPNLRVSPSRSPSWLASTSSPRSMTVRWGDREETTNFYLIVGYTEQEDAGSTLAAGLHGPKSGVHFHGRDGEVVEDEDVDPRETRQHAAVGAKPENGVNPR